MNRSRAGRDAIVAALAYAALVAALAWPLVTRPDSALVDPEGWADSAAGWAKGDLDLLVWIVAWTAHAALHHPLEPFQGNLFHPAPDALASSEHLLGLLPVTGPTFWLSDNPILTYNLAALVVVWTAAFTMYLLVRAWTGRGSAAFLAGSLFALGDAIPLGFVRLHSSAIHLYPLVLLLAWRVAERPRLREGIGLIVATALQALSGIYVAFGLGTFVAAATPALIRHARRHGRTGIVPLAALAAGVLPLALIAGPYLRLRAAGLLPDPAAAFEVVAATSGTVTGLAGTLLSEMTWIGLVLAAIGLVSRHAARDVRFCLASIAVVGFLLALGTNAAVPALGWPSLYGLLMRVVPGFSGMRAPQRFLYQTQLAAGALAGIGAASLLDLAARRFGDAALRAVAAGFVAFALLAVPFRARHWPLPLLVEPQSGLYVGAHRWLAEHAEPGPVLDLPAQTSPLDTRALRSTGRAMLGATLHWYPLLNGYSGYPPGSHPLVMTLAQRLPDARALRDLCAVAAPRWIVVHHGLLPSGSEDLWHRATETLPLTEVHRRGKDSIYEVRCPPERIDVVNPPPAARLGPDARRADLGLETTEIPAGRLSRLWATVANLGDETWPGLRPAGAGPVVLHSRWRDAAGAIVSEDPPTPLARDLPPGERVRAQFETLPPGPGEWTLELEVAQEGGPPFAPVGPSRFAMRIRPADAPSNADPPPTGDAIEP